MFKLTLFSRILRFFCKNDINIIKFGNNITKKAATQLRGTMVAETLGGVYDPPEKFLYYISSPQKSQKSKSRKAGKNEGGVNSPGKIQRGVKW